MDLPLCNCSEPLTEIIKKMSEENGEVWLWVLRKILRKENPFMWSYLKTIDLGNNMKNGQDILFAMNQQGIHSDPPINEIIGNPNFVVFPGNKEVDLVTISPVELGLMEERTSYGCICKRAVEIGLEKCPAEVGPQLCLQNGLPSGEELIICMEPNPPTTKGVHSIFYVSTLVKNNPKLSVYNGSLNVLWAWNRRFVFVLPRK